MRLSRHRHRTQVDLNMTPMIDVVFLLLIFFMTASQVSQISKSEVELPKQVGMEEQNESLTIVNVTQSGEYYVMAERMSLPQVITHIGAEIARKGNEPTLVSVVIRADERGTSQPVNELVKALARMQVSRIRIAVQEPQ